MVLVQKDGYISKVAASVMALWVAVAALSLGASAVLLFTGVLHVGITLAVSASVLASFTSTIHNRIYVERICGVIRVTRHLEDREGAQVRSVR